jgi:hypothetical protein
MFKSFVYSKLVRLTTSLQVGAKYFGCVVVGSTLPLVPELRPDRRYKQIVWSHRQASKHQPSEVVSFSYWFD